MIKPVRALWRLLPADLRRVAVARLGAFGLPRRPVEPPLAPADLPVIILGPVSLPTGLGRAARLSRDALRAAGRTVLEVDIGGLFAGKQTARPAILPDRAVILVHMSPLFTPYVLRQLPRRLLTTSLVIGVWHWELPKLPEGWRFAGAAVDRIWAPTRFVRDALACCHDRPIDIVPHPLPAPHPEQLSIKLNQFERLNCLVNKEPERNHAPLAARSAPGERPASPDQPLTVITLFNAASGFERKNPLAALAAFRQAFGDRPDRALLVKASGLATWPDGARRLRAMLAGMPNARLIDTEGEDDEIANMLRRADILLSLHRSEGFGLVLAEAMLLGVPVVATDGSGPVDFLTQDCACLVPAWPVPAIDPQRACHAPHLIWDDPDINAAARHLVALADDPERRRHLAGAARARARLLFDPARYAARLADLAIPRRSPAESTR